MPIRIVIERRGSELQPSPRIFCDHCGRRIVGEDDGNVVWATDAEGEPIGEIHFTHRRCMASFERADRERPGSEQRVLAAEMLHTWLAQLADNARRL